MDSAVSEAPLFAPRQPGPRVQADESPQAWQLDHTRAPVATKIVVAGGFGVGKTTFVGSVSEITPLQTEALMTQASEQELTASVTLPDGQQVTLRGFADRLEVDADGSVVVIDFKTGKYKPTNDEVKVHPQLGLYQLAVENGAVDDLVATPPARAAGAELVQLRHGANNKVNIQWQGEQPVDDEGNRPVELQLMTAVGLIRDEEFPARAGKHCDRCAFTAICPIQGAGTVLS